LSAQPLRANDGEALLNRWLAAQTNMRTWSADFVQTRTLKTFTQPLKSEGHVWFAAPNRFRWELGQQTIAIRGADKMSILYPRLKRAEVYPLSGNLPSQWKDALGLLEAGFPRDRKDLDARFNIDSVNVAASLFEVNLHPRSAQARRMMPRIKIVLSIEDSSLRATELHFADGSIMRNDFSNPKLNEPFDEKLFSPEIPPDFKVVEPLKQKK
jgi:outer membrane lipoprotein-sorting protein